MAGKKKDMKVQKIKCRWITDFNVKKNNKACIKSSRITEYLQELEVGKDDLNLKKKITNPKGKNYNLGSIKTAILTKKSTFPIS